MERRQVDEETVAVGGQEIAFRQSPGNQRTVVFAHGNSSSSRPWGQLMAGQFGQRYRCLALDLPGHGRSAPASNHSIYSLPGCAATLAAFARALAAEDAVIVGWSLGGHTAIETAPSLPEAAGFLISGTSRVASAAQMAEAFLPDPALNVGFSARASVSQDQALAYASSFVAPGSALPLDEFVADILSTDGDAREGLFASVGDGRFADEVDIVATLRRPLAILQGENEQLGQPGLPPPADHSGPLAGRSADRRRGRARSARGGATGARRTAGAVHRRHRVSVTRPGLGRGRRAGPPKKQPVGHPTYPPGQGVRVTVIADVTALAPQLRGQPVPDHHRAELGSPPMTELSHTN